MTIRNIAALTIASLSLIACVGGDEEVETSDVQNVTAKNGGQVELYRSQADGEFRYRVKAKNGEIILVGEGYEAKAGVEHAIELIEREGAEEGAYELLPSSSNEDELYDAPWYFNFVAGNGAVVGSSEVYSTKGSAQNGMAGLMGYVAGGLHIDDWTDQCGLELYTGNDGDYWIRMRAENGEPLMRGEGYSSEAAAKEGIDDVITWAWSRESFEVLKSTNGQFYFNLKAPNGEILGTSETYVQEASAENAIEAVLEIADANQECWTADL